MIRGHILSFFSYTFLGDVDEKNSDSIIILLPFRSSGN